MEFVEFLESKETSSVCFASALIDIADAAWKATTIFVKKKTTHWCWQRKLESSYSFVVTELSALRYLDAKSSCQTLLVAMANSFVKHHKASMKQKESWTRCCTSVLLWPREIQEVVVGPHRAVPGQTQLPDLTL